MDDPQLNSEQDVSTTFEEPQGNDEEVSNGNRGDQQGKEDEGREDILEITEVQRSQEQLEKPSGAESRPIVAEEVTEGPDADEVESRGAQEPVPQLETSDEIEGKGAAGKSEETSIAELQPRSAAEVAEGSGADEVEDEGATLKSVESSAEGPTAEEIEGQGKSEEPSVVELLPSSAAEVAEGSAVDETAGKGTIHKPREGRWRVVELLAEFRPEKELKSMISAIFGANAPSPDSHAERKHKQEFKMHYPAPNISRVLYDIGLQLAQELTYSDIVCMKNLPSEMPRKPDTIKKVVSQVKPFLEMLKTQTDPYKLQRIRCSKCPYKGPPINYVTPVVKVDVANHYESEHGCEALFEKPPAKAPCPFCPEDFVYKGNLQQHLKLCKRHWKDRNILTLTEDDRLTVNRWLWPKPTDLPGSGVSTGVRVLQLPSQHSGVQFITASSIGGTGSGPTVIRLPNLNTAASADVRRQKILLQQQQQINQQTQAAAAAASQQAFAVRSTHPVDPVTGGQSCEICDSFLTSRDKYFEHLQTFHRKLLNKTRADFMGGAPLACSRCRERFWTYEGLERHLVMIHALVTSDLLKKAQSKLDSGRCTFCNKQYAFNLLQHLVMDHKKRLCSAEILYSCDVCSYQCTSYTDLERHLTAEHGAGKKAQAPVVSRSFTTGTASGAKRPAGPTSEHEPATKSARMVQTTLDSNRMTQKEQNSQKKSGKVRYTCTPCALKFPAYADVIKHWQDRHLAKVKIMLCRVDQCQPCKEKFEKDGIRADSVFPDPEIESGTEDATDTEIICLD